MKIALLYSGLPTLDIDILLSHKKYIWDIYDIDIYLSTYLVKDTDIYIINDLINFVKFKRIDVQNFYDIDHIFSSIEKKIKSKNPETIPINTLSMFYKINRCFLLLKDNYDIVIRHRLDVSLDSPLSLYENDGINVPCGGDHSGGLLDLFAFGSYSCMRGYCDLFNRIPYYLEEMNQNFHPESLLRFHCNYNQIPIYRFDYNLYLRGQLFTKTAACIE